MYTKRALIRDQETPMGQPGRMHLVCECGHKIDIDRPFDSDAEYTCPCGIVYNGWGFITARPTVLARR